MILTLGGDMMLNRAFNQLFAVDPNYNVWGNLLPHLRQTDFFGANLETAITDSDTPWTPKVFNYRLLPQYASVLKQPPVDYVSIANNHILDYRRPGLIDTLNTLDSLGIAYAGAGRNLREAQRPAIIDTSIGKIAFLSATDHPSEWESQKGREGTFYIDVERGNWGSALEVVRKLRLDSQIKTIIFSLHWGPNWSWSVSPQRQRFAWDLLHSGVDIIHGHSSHHVQKVEMIHGGIVFYGIGDLIDDYAVDLDFRSDLSFIADINLTSNGRIADTQILPTKIRHRFIEDLLYADVNFATANDANWVYQHI